MTVFKYEEKSKLNLEAFSLNRGHEAGNNHVVLGLTSHNRKFISESFIVPVVTDNNDCRIFIELTAKRLAEVSNKAFADFTFDPDCKATKALLRGERVRFSVITYIEPMIKENGMTACSHYIVINNEIVHVAILRDSNTDYYNLNLSGDKDRFTDSYECSNFNSNTHNITDADLQDENDYFIEKDIEEKKLFNDTLMLPLYCIENFDAHFKVFTYISVQKKLYIRDTYEAVKACLPQTVIECSDEMDLFDKLFTDNTTPDLVIMNDKRNHYIRLTKGHVCIIDILVPIAH